MEFTTIPIIVILCGICMSLIKLFTKGNSKETEILAALVPACGALIGLLLYFIHSEYTMEFDDPIVAIMIGFVSGQSALETKSTFDYIKSKKDITDIIVEELQTDTVTEIIKETIDPIIETTMTDATTLIEEKTEIVKEELQEKIEDIKNDNIE